MKKILFVVLAFGLPNISFGATYYYVTENAVTHTVEASSAASALILAEDIAWNSGVAIDRGDIKSGMKVSRAVIENGPSFAAIDGNQTGNSLGTGGPNRYFYVTTSGHTASVEAPSPDVALMIAPNKAANSGVAIDDGTIEAGDRVNGAM
jgi:hypothetical protein